MFILLAVDVKQTSPAATIDSGSRCGEHVSAPNMAEIGSIRQGLAFRDDPTTHWYSLRRCRCR
jgi:hypothetical protein